MAATDHRTGFVLARMGLVPSGDAVTIRFEEAWA